MKMTPDEMEMMQRIKDGSDECIVELARISHHHPEEAIVMALASAVALAKSVNMPLALVMGGLQQAWRHFEPEKLTVQ